MLKKTLSICAATVIAAGAANAQMFTYTVEEEEPTSVGAEWRDGTPFGGAYWSGVSNMTYTDGATKEENYTCVSMTQPPRDSLFMAHVVCDATTPDGTYSSTWGCNYIDEAREKMSCVGGLVGTGGALEGRSGTATFMGGGGGGKGTGHWYE